MPNNIGNIYENLDLTKYNTYHIKTSTKYMICPNNTDELINLFKYIKNDNIKYFIIGNGSNVILPDTKFNGILISLKNMNKIELLPDNRLNVMAGAMLPIVANYAINNNLKGLEWAVGIPGTLGGAIYGNAEAYLCPIMNYVKEITILNKDNELKTITPNDITYGYRTTSIKEQKEDIVISAILQLLPGNKEESLALALDRKQRRFASQPLEYPSAGSVFRNPSKELPAGKLIEEASLKGTNIGGAEISLKHGNFIINKDNATAKDIIELINLIKKTIKEKNNIDLVCEQEIIDWN